MSKSSLRNVIGEYIVNLGDKDDKVLVVNADLSGTCRNRSFTEKYPNRSFNVGIAEQNMISFAAGLASEGYKPYTFTMAPFLSMRACEQVRTDVAYGKKNVKMIGVYAGVSGGISGATHWALEDVGIMASIPNIAIFEVSDAYMAQKVMDYSIDYDGPMYIRCGVEPTEDLNMNAEIYLGGSRLLLDGNDGAIICSGVVVQYALEAAKIIKARSGKSIRIIDMYSIKPIDVEAVLCAANTGVVIVAQDHNVIGGLGSAVAKIIAENGLSVKMKILGIDDCFFPMAHASYLYRQLKLDTNGLVSTFSSMMEI